MSTPMGAPNVKMEDEALELSCLNFVMCRAKVSKVYKSMDVCSPECFLFKQLWGLEQKDVRAKVLECIEKIKNV